VDKKRNVLKYSFKRVPRELINGYISAGTYGWRSSFSTYIIVKNYFFIFFSRFLPISGGLWSMINHARGFTN